MKVLTYYDRQDDFPIDLPEKISNGLLGILRTPFGKKVTVSFNHRGEKVLDEEYSTAKVKAGIIALNILLLPFALLAIAIGIVIHRFSSTYGQNLLSEKKIDPQPAERIELPNPVRPTSRVIVEFKNRDYKELTCDEFLNLLETQGDQVINLMIKGAPVSLSALLAYTPNLECLYLLKCKLGEEALSGFSTSLPNLKKLVINDCDLTSEELQTWNQVRFQSLTELDLSHNWLDDDAIGPIVDSLRACKLKILVLNDNQFTAKGITPLADSETFFYLELLQLDENPIEGDFEALFAANLPNLREPIRFDFPLTTAL